MCNIKGVIAVLWIAHVLACGSVVDNRGDAGAGGGSEDAGNNGGGDAGGGGNDAGGSGGADAGGSGDMDAGAILTITPAVLDFGPVSTAVEPASQTVTITNHASVAAQLVLAFSGPSATSFAIEQSDCDQPVAPAAMCSVKIKLVVSRTGSYMASLDVTAPVGRASAGLAAIGVSAELTLSPERLDFGDVALPGTSTQMFTLTNAGEVSLAAPMLTLSGSGSSAFVTGQNTCTQALAPHASCTFAATFRPSQAGVQTATVSAESGTLLAAAPLAGRGTAQVMISQVGSSGGRGTVFGCTSTCTMTVTTSPITMIAQPASNSWFDGWSGDAAACGTNTTCVLPITKPTTSVVGNFTAD